MDAGVEWKGCWMLWDYEIVLPTGGGLAVGIRMEMLGLALRLASQEQAHVSKSRQAGSENET